MYKKITPNEDFILSQGLKIFTMILAHEYIKNINLKTEYKPIPNFTLSVQSHGSCEVSKSG